MHATTSVSGTLSNHEAFEAMDAWKEAFERARERRQLATLAKSGGQRGGGGALATLNLSTTPSSSGGSKFFTRANIDSSHEPVATHGGTTHPASSCVSCCELRFALLLCFPVCAWPRFSFVRSDPRVICVHHGASTILSFINAYVV